MPRFAILRHETPLSYTRPSHWDVMLEAEGVLRTWATIKPLDCEDRILAERLPDHRLEYLEFEGELSAHRGTVTRLDQGVWNWIAIPQRGWRESRYFFVRLFGQRIQGSLLLSGDDLHGWYATFSQDRSAVAEAVETS